jgi:hypothetical protein
MLEKTRPPDAPLITPPRHVPERQLLDAFTKKYKKNPQKSEKIQEVAQH